MKTILVIIAAIVLAFFVPWLGLGIGVGMIIFNKQLDPNGASSGLFNFQGLWAFLGGASMVVMSGLVLAVRAFG